MSQSPDASPASTSTGQARTIELIVVHCSATPSGERLGGGLGNRRVTAPQVIDRWHMQRGFARAADAVAEYNPGLPHIGYHYVIDLDGHIHGGRRIAEIGAHCKGYNANSIGICLVGGLEPQARYTAAQWDSLKRLCITLTRQRPAAQVLGHRDLNAGRTCPGFDVAAWWNNRCTPPLEQVL
jgi:hypothetical protein